MFREYDTSYNTCHKAKASVYFVLMKKRYYDFHTESSWCTLQWAKKAKQLHNSCQIKAEETEMCFAANITKVSMTNIFVFTFTKYTWV